MVEYPASVKAVLDAEGATAGDRVRVTAGGRTYQGVVMPHTEFSGADILVLKLDNGYNVGIPVSAQVSVDLLERHIDRAAPRRIPPPKPGRPTTRHGGVEPRSRIVRMPPALLDLFLELCTIPSPPGKERAVADRGDHRRIGAGELGAERRGQAQCDFRHAAGLHATFGSF